MNFLKYDSSIMKILGKVFDLVCLNVFFVLLCIPLITVGAGLCGLYRGCLCVYKGEGSPVKAMWRAFKSNFRLATFVWLGELIAAAILASLLILGGALGGIVAMIPAIIVAIVFLLQLGTVFPLLSRFENGILATVKNALLLSLRHLPASAAVVALNLLPAAVHLVSPELFMSLIWLWGFGVYALIVLLQACCLEKNMFAPYID